ncbi:MAG: hypothetical protein K2Y39_20670 [Candidatus Obscuribacterales bacterium]|nr:hypothetical protein [Candidatus Obscuribacterales bacterium]
MKPSDQLQRLTVAVALMALCCPSATAKHGFPPPDIVGDDAGYPNGKSRSLLGISPELLRLRSRSNRGFHLSFKNARVADKFFPKEAQLSDIDKQSLYPAYAAMGEKSFLSLSKNDTVYRFLWLRSYHHPVCVSIKIIDHGNRGAILHAIELDGRDAPDVPLGKQVRKVSYQYYPKLAKELVAKIEATKFWNIPLNDELLFRTKQKNDQLNASIHKSALPLILYRPASNNYDTPFDGADWIMEGWNEGKYRMVRRFSPRDGGFRELCMIFLLLAHIYPENPHEVY